jgi:hypothetical protein
MSTQVLHEVAVVSMHVAAAKAMSTAAVFGSSAPAALKMNTAASA